MKILLLILLVLIKKGYAQNIPENGAIQVDHGRLRIIGGVLVARTDLNLDRYILENTEAVYKDLDGVMYAIRRYTTGLRSAQISTLERKVGICQYLFNKLVNHIDQDFLEDRLNVTSRTEMGERWKVAVRRALHEGKSENLTTYGSSNESATKLNRCYLSDHERELVEEVHGPLTDEEICDGFQQLHDLHHGKGKYSDQFWSLKRPKRSWFDAGGNVLKMVFGVATEEDIRRNSESIRNITSTTNKLIVRNKQVEGLIEHALNHIKDVFSKLEDTDGAIRALQNYVVLSQLVGELITILSHLLSLAVELETRMALLKKGIVPPMLTDQQIVGLIKEGESRFLNLKFPIETEDVGRNHAKILSLFKALPTNDKHMYTIVIPFVDKEKTYDVTQLYAFPVVSSVGSLVIPDIPPYVGVGTDDYVLIDNLDDCEIVEDFHLCYNTMPRNTNFSSCAIGLIRNESEVINKVCKFYEVEIRYGYYAVALHNAWVIYFRDSMFGTYTCPGDREGEMVKMIGVAIVKSPCSLTISGATFGTIQKVEFEVERNEIEVIPLSKIDVPVSTLTVDESRIIDNINNDLLELKKLQPVDSVVTLSRSVWIPLIGGSGLVGLILFVILIYLCMRRLRQARTHNGTDLPVPCGSTQSRGSRFVRAATVELDVEMDSRGFGGRGGRLPHNPYCAQGGAVVVPRERATYEDIPSRASPDTTGICEDASPSDSSAPVRRMHWST